MDALSPSSARTHDIEFKRSDFDVEVRVRIDASSRSSLFCGLDGQADRGGVFVATYRALTVGTDVALVVDSDLGTFEACGVVRFLAEGGGDGERGVGIAFTRIDADQRRVLGELARTRPPLYFDAFDGDASVAASAMQPALERCA
jgi:Tfp pilus assembly protein PilZ